MRRYVTDEVIKQAAGSADDEDMYNQETMTSSSTPGAGVGSSGRLLVSHYNVSPHQYPLLQGTTVAYVPHHHHHHHHLLHQHPAAAVQSTQQVRRPTVCRARARARTFDLLLRRRCELKL